MYGADECPTDIKTKLPSTPVFKFEAFLALGQGVPDSKELVARVALQKPGHSYMYSDSFLWDYRFTEGCHVNTRQHYRDRASYDRHFDGWKAGQF
jgi:hypothetical protein